MTEKGLIGFVCAYTPLALIHAAGFTPYRIMPEEKSPDQAGRILHDNLCPHVKRLLDRAAAGNIPELKAMVIMNSCDAMRRLHDAWLNVVPGIPPILVDLPVTASDSAAAFFRNELKRLGLFLESRGGRAPEAEKISHSLDLYNDMAEKFAQLRQKVQTGRLENGSAALQACYNQASTGPPETMIQALSEKLAEPDADPSPDTVPIYLFGNMIPDPAAFSLFEACGARIIAEDLCTGSRLFTQIPVADPDYFLDGYAAGLLGRRPCPRTFEPSDPGKLARDIASAASRHNAKGVIGYTLKFCDPYAARLPNIRMALKKAGLPFLFLEGDCTLQTMGQQKTRIEAFIEMMR